MPVYLAAVPVYLAAAAAVSSVVSIVAAEILMAAALIALLARNKWSKPPAMLLWPILAWMFWTLVSLAVNGHFHDGLPQIKKFIWFAMPFIVYYGLRELPAIRSTVLVWAAVALASSLWSFVQFAHKYHAARAAHLDFYTAYVADRITGFMGHWMTFSGQMMMALMLAGALLLFSHDSSAQDAAASSLGPVILPWRSVVRGLLKKWKAPIAIAALFIAAALFLAETRSMWGGAVAGAVYLILFSGRRWLLLAIPIAAVLLYAANPFDVRERMISILYPHGDVDSNEHRAVLRIIGAEMIHAHPLFGVGPEQVGKQYQRYIPPSVPRPLPTGYYGHLHNIYFHYAAERGLPALAALLWFLIGAIWTFEGALRRLPPESEARWILHAAIAVIIAVMVGGYFEVNLGDSEVLAMFLAVIGCGYSAAHTAHAAQAQPDRA